MGVKASSYSDRHPGGDARRTIGDGMRVRHVSKALTTAALLGTMLATAIITTSGGAAAAAAATSSAPGVTSNTLTITVTNANPAPVNFTVTGVNPTTGSSVTASNGQAQFCYSGTASGADTVTGTVSSGAIGTATVNWSSSSGISPSGVDTKCRARMRVQS